MVGECVLSVTGEERVVQIGRVAGEGVYTVITNEVRNVTRRDVSHWIVRL
jgi:hypothetical protein